MYCRTLILCAFSLPCFAQVRQVAEQQHGNLGFQFFGPDSEKIDSVTFLILRDDSLLLSAVSGNSSRIFLEIAPVTYTFIAKRKGFTPKTYSGFKVREHARGLMTVHLTPEELTNSERHLNNEHRK